jgi:hypothetical protein
MVWWTTCSSKEGYATSHRQRHRNAKEEARLSCCWKNIGILYVLIVAEVEEGSVWLLLCQMYLCNLRIFNSPHRHLSSLHHFLFPNYHLIIR